MNEKHQMLLKTAAKVILAQQKQLDYVVEELAKAKHQENAAKLANELVKSGKATREEFDQLVEKIAALKNIGSVKQALELLPTPKKDLPIGSVEKVASETKTAEQKLMADPAVEYLMQFVGTS